MNSPSIRCVTVAGAGVLGAQIAFQAAVHGFDVRLYDIDEAAIEAGRQRLATLKMAYDTEAIASAAQTAAALDSIQLTTVLSDALEDADLLIEAIPERLDIKQAFYTKVQGLAPPKTIFASNSSTLTPSQLVSFTGRPGRFLHLHFAAPVRHHNIAEIMGHPDTAPAVFDAVVAFSKKIGMVAVPIDKEQPGYVLNTLLIPFLLSALSLVSKGIATYQIIDKTWMICTDAKAGPFGAIDEIGITTAYNITRNLAEENPTSDGARIADYLKGNFIDTGRMGVGSGAGFYTYPNPEYLRSDFLK